jgi:hypothetical protein
MRCAWLQVLGGIVCRPRWLKSARHGLKYIRDFKVGAISNLALWQLNYLVHSNSPLYSLPGAASCTYTSPSDIASQDCIGIQEAVPGSE